MLGPRPLRLLASVAVVCALASTTACNAFKTAPPAPFDIVVRVESDPGHPVAGAALIKAGNVGPSTGPDGSVQVKIGGLEGETVDLSVRCPAGFVSPLRPLSVLLRRNVGGKLPEYKTECPPEVRHMVIAVRADNGANLPVKVLNQLVGYTDGAGSFTHTVTLKPGDGVDMTIDTSNHPLLSPQNPSRTLTMAPHDDVVTFDQKFDVAVIKKPYIPPTFAGCLGSSCKHPVSGGPHKGLY
jgi:hypothetical protein